MSEEYGPDFVTLTDEDGNEFVLEHIDTIELNGKIYMSFFPVIEAEDDSAADAEEDEDEEDGDPIIILRLDEIDGEELLCTIEDDDEAEAAFDAFMEALFDDDEE